MYNGKYYNVVNIEKRSKYREEELIKRVLQEKNESSFLGFFLDYTNLYNS